MPLGLDHCCNMNSVPLALIKRLFSVPICCVLPEDKVSGLAMQGKPVALSRGATSSLPHRLVKIETEEFGVTRTTSGRSWTILQDIQDRSTDHVGTPRHETVLVTLDTVNPAGPNTVDKARLSCVVM